MTRFKPSWMRSGCSSAVGCPEGMRRRLRSGTTSTEADSSSGERVEGLLRFIHLFSVWAFVGSSAGLAGCGGLTYFGDRLRAVDRDTTGETGLVSTESGGTIGTVELEIDAVEPSFGSNGGGSEVVVFGRFDADTVVGFGGKEAVVSSRTATELVVTVPANVVTGSVDVTVASGPRSAVLADGFEYFADATGRAGTFGYVEFYHMVGGYWAAPEDFAGAAFAFVEPTDWEASLEYAPALDSCTAVDSYTGEPTWIVTGATTWEFDANGPQFEIPQDPDSPGLFASDAEDAPISVTEVVPGATYDLHATPASVGWPLDQLSPGVSVPSSFTVSQPNLAADDAPPQKKNSFSISWTGAGGDYVLIFLLRREADQTATVVTCAAADDGSFTVPGTVWATWPTGLFMDVLVGRVTVERNLLPTNNGENRVAGVYWVYGGVVTD